MGVGRLVEILEPTDFEKDQYEQMKNLMRELCELTGEKYSERRFRGAVRRRILDRSGSKGVILADDNGLAVGMVFWDVVSSPSAETYAYLSNFIISGPYRKKKIGKMLMERLEEILLERNISRIDSNIRNLEAEGRFFESLGFKHKYCVVTKTLFPRKDESAEEK